MVGMHMFAQRQIKFENLLGGQSIRNRFAVAPCEFNLFGICVFPRGTCFTKLFEQSLLTRVDCMLETSKAGSPVTAHTQKRLSSHGASANLYLILLNAFVVS